MQPDELRTMAAHLAEAGERSHTVRDDAASVTVGDLGVPAADEAAGELLRRWSGAARELGDRTTDAGRHLVRCARAYESADADALRGLGLR